MGLRKLLFERPDETGSRFGFTSVILIALAVLIPSYFNLSIYSDPRWSKYLAILIVGLPLAFIFGMELDRKTRSNRKKWDATQFMRMLLKQATVILIGVTIGVILVLVNGLLGLGNLLIGSVITTNDDLTVAISLCILAGVSEEIFFRGFVQNMIRSYVPFLVFAVVPSAFIFAWFHTATGSLSAIAFVILFIVGIILGLLHEISNDIGVSMIAHITNNTFALLPILVPMILNGSTIGFVFVLMVIVVIGFVCASFGSTRSRSR